MNYQSLILRYSAFAVFSIFLNLAVQRIVLGICTSQFSFFLAMFAGTLAGLLCKYILDKYWIFSDTSKGLKDNSKKFALYSFMGVFTTIIFWGTESFFYFVWKTELMREIGAILGLSVGYIIKYHLDARFVFTQIEEQTS